MTIVGGFDVHRKQLTFDYVDTETGRCDGAKIRPATRKTLRSWLAEHCPRTVMRSSPWRAAPGGGMWPKS